MIYYFLTSIQIIIIFSVTTTNTKPKYFKCIFHKRIHVLYLFKKKMTKTTNNGNVFKSLFFKYSLLKNNLYSWAFVCYPIVVIVFQTTFPVICILKTFSMCSHFKIIVSKYIFFTSRVFFKNILKIYFSLSMFIYLKYYI